MGLDRLLADCCRSIRRRINPVSDIECNIRFRLYTLVTMTYQEYNDRRNDIVNAYNNGEMNLPDLQYELAKLDKEYDCANTLSEYRYVGGLPDYSSPDWTKRAEEAIAKMKETHRKVKKDWAHAYVDGDRVKIKKGPSGLPLVDMSILEARLLASEILSITNKQRRKRK